MRKSIAAAAAIMTAMTGAPAVHAQRASAPPPWSGVYQPQGVDEIGLWREDDERERQLAASPVVIQDEQLTSYIHSVLCDTVGHDRCGGVRVYVLREPTFNATMSPNGTMRVFSGLLLRVRNEAELGAVLAHEFGHFEKRHNLAGFRSRRGGTDVLAWAGLLASVAPSHATRVALNDIQLSIFGDIFRHNRNQEREADLLGIGYLNSSALRPQAASEVWQALIGEIEASTRARGLRQPNFNAVAFTASHPPQGERAAYLAELAQPEGAVREDGAARYRAALAPWLPTFLEDQVKINDFGGSEYLINRLASDGWTADLWLARGELYRARGAQRDLVNAASFYSNAIDLNPSLAGAHRGLGLSLMKTGKSAEGKAALRSYLALAPNAPDEAMIRMMAPAEERP